MVFRFHPPRLLRARVMLAALAAMQLPDPQALVKRHPHQLSGGQCQRVLIAMAFAARPELIVADEPTTALDVMTQARVMRLLLQQQNMHGTSVMLITHDLLMAAHVCDEIIVLHAGEIVERGAAVDVLMRPQHPYTRALVAATPRLPAVPLPDAAPLLPQPRQPSPKTALLSVRNLNLHYPAPSGWLDWIRRNRRKTTPALRDVSFDVYPGECVGIVGESGSGKSSLARVLMGLHTGTHMGTHAHCKGSVVLDGVPVLGPQGGSRKAATQVASHIRTRAQIIFQDPHSALNPRRSVRRLLTQGEQALPRKTGAANPAALDGVALEDRLHALLDSIGLPAQLLTRYPAQLSGGQKQRVNIGRGLFLAPKLLLADEIVSGLDMTVQAQILRLLKDLAQGQGIAIVLISHDLAVVRQLCQRVIVMHQGQVVEQGRVAEVFAHPVHDYTRRLLAAVPGGNPQTQAWPPQFGEG